MEVGEPFIWCHVRGQERSVQTMAVSDYRERDLGTFFLICLLINPGPGVTRRLCCGFVQKSVSYSVSKN